MSKYYNEDIIKKYNERNEVFIPHYINLNYETNEILKKQVNDYSKLCKYLENEIHDLNKKIKKIKKNKKQNLDCIICYEDKVSKVFIPCGHICVCNDCYNKINGCKCLYCGRPSQGTIMCYATGF